MLSLLGSLLGFAGSAVPAITDHFASKEDRKHELDKMRMVAELRKEGYDFDLKMYETMGADKEHERLIQHDISINKGSGIIAGLQKSVRPVITYAFFGLFATIPSASTSSPTRKLHRRRDPHLIRVSLLGGDTAARLVRLFSWLPPATAS